VIVAREALSASSHSTFIGINTVLAPA